MSGSWPLLAAIIALLLLLLGVALALVATSPAASTRPLGRGRAVARSSFGGGAARLKQAAIIINPSKVADDAALRARLTATCTRLGWAEPLFIPTTVEDPGTGQAREAIEAGADLVCPLGGDGTIRAVAAALSGTRTPMGLLPSGTGNLLARNLDIPLDSLEAALELACTGRNRTLDLGWVSLDPPAEARADDEAQAQDPEVGPTVERHLFLVMAGVGFDAAVMSSTSDEFKAKVGWPAYFAVGIRHLWDERIKVTFQIDDDKPVTRRIRTLVVGNCGKLTGGITLMPEAEVDDGILDIVVVAPKGVFGWGSVAGRVLAKSAKKSDRFDRYRGERVLVTTDEPREVQLDGDVVGSATQILVEVAAGALVVRAGV
ncbi:MULTISPECIES: diacylglycerol/lipid kinase family protein [unclassified Janibacter]|uniref:diacylglycerol/lipid kinase family protein n=1 Tax=unclassified Janibacter TaxID=2649294 RepID=UPI003D059421